MITNKNNDDSAEKNDIIITLDLIHMLENTAYFRSAIVSLAENLEPLTAKKANILIESLTEMGEDLALNRLLNVCAIQNLHLDPEILSNSTAVIDDITHLPFCFSNQNAEAIPYILKAAHSKELSLERQTMLVRIAAELSLKFEAPSNEIENFLQYLATEVTAPQASILISDTLNLLDKGELEADLFPILINNDIHHNLPETPPCNIIGGGETIRRPIPKLGRNEPCHCGSGKKYKRCCFQKDREILADASSYEGITKTQLNENPGIVDDSAVIDSLRAYEVKKLNPEKLSTGQLIPAYWRASNFGLLEIAFAMLVELSKRTDGEFDFDPGHFASIVDEALKNGDIELAQRARDLIPTDLQWIDWDEMDMTFEMCINPGILETIELRCQQAITHQSDDDMFRSHDFCNLAHIFRHKFPALSIIFARSAIQECPDRVFDNELLVENVHQTRIELGMDFFGDPIDDAFEKSNQECFENKTLQEQSGKYKELQEQLKQARDQSRNTSRKLTENENELLKVKNKLDKIKKLNKSEEQSASAPLDKESIDKYKNTMSRLRRQIDNLKSEVGNQQGKRRTLQKELEKEKKRTHKTPKKTSQKGEDEDTQHLTLPDEHDRKILIPEYTNNFRDACIKMPTSVTASALKAIAGFAAYDNSIWKHSRRIKQLTGIYRIRIGIHYRVLLNWIPGHNLTALNIIPRQNLEAWIKRHT